MSWTFLESLVKHTSEYSGWRRGVLCVRTMKNGRAHYGAFIHCSHGLRQNDFSKTSYGSWEELVIHSFFTTTLLLFGYLQEVPHCDLISALPYDPDRNMPEKLSLFTQKAERYLKNWLISLAWMKFSFCFSPTTMSETPYERSNQI